LFLKDRDNFFYCNGLYISWFCNNQGGRIHSKGLRESCRRWTTYVIFWISCQYFYVKISTDNKVYDQFVFLGSSFLFSFIYLNMFVVIGYMHAILCWEDYSIRIYCSFFHNLILVFNSCLERISEYWIILPLLDTLKIGVFFDCLAVLFPHVSSFHLFITLPMI
jgi:hypothetical protein